MLGLLVRFGDDDGDRLTVETNLVRVQIHDARRSRARLFAARTEDGGLLHLRRVLVRHNGNDARRVFGFCRINTLDLPARDAAQDHRGVRDIFELVFGGEGRRARCFQTPVNTAERLTDSARFDNVRAHTLAPPSLAKAFKTLSFARCASSILKELCR